MQELVDNHHWFHWSGQGLLNAIVINDDEDSHTAWDLCVALQRQWLALKTYPRQNIIRFAPAIGHISEEQLLICCDIITNTVFLNFQVRE